MNTIGQRIAHLRKKKNLTQPELAELIGVSVGAVSQWERGIIEPAINNLKALCQVLETPLEWLAFGTGVSSSEEYLVDITQALEQDTRYIQLNDSQREFVMAFSALSPDWQENIIELVHALAGTYGKATQ